MEFTDPFTKASCSPRSDDTKFFSFSPLSPLLTHNPSPSDFMGVAGDEPADGSDTLLTDFDFSLFGIKGDPSRPAIDCLKPDYGTMSSPDHPYNPLYYDHLSEQSSAELDYAEYSAWVRTDF